MNEPLLFSIMFRRLFAVALISSGLLALPILCQAGMLAHACADDQSSECGHEESCASDPCAMDELATGRTPSPDDGALHCVALAPLTTFDGAPVFSFAAPAARRHAPLVTPLFLRSGALPLLI